MTDKVEIRIEGHVAEVMLNRPDKFNALDVETFQALDSAARTIAGDTAIRAVVLHGAGDNFCAGIDLGVLQGGGENVARALLALSPGDRRLCERYYHGGWTAARTRS